MAELAEFKSTLKKHEREKARCDERLDNLLKQKKEIGKELKAVGVKSINEIPEREKELKEELTLLINDLEDVKKGDVNPQETQDDEPKDFLDKELDEIGQLDDPAEELDDPSEKVDEKPESADAMDDLFDGLEL